MLQKGATVHDGLSTDPWQPWLTGSKVEGSGSITDIERRQLRYRDGLTRANHDEQEEAQHHGAHWNLAALLLQNQKPSKRQYTAAVGGWGRTGRVPLVRPTLHCIAPVHCLAAREAATNQRPSEATG